VSRPSGRLPGLSHGWQRARRVYIACAVLGFVLCASLPVDARPAVLGTSTYVFYEKFPSNNPHRWTTQVLADGSKTYLDSGTYMIVRAHPGLMRGWPMAVRVPAAVEFNAKLAVKAGKDAYEGITFWDDRAGSFVLFAVTPDGQAGLFRHAPGLWKTLVAWRREPAIHRGVGAVNALSVDLDGVSAARGRTFLINGVPLGRPCADSWLASLGSGPSGKAQPLSVGLVAGSFKGSTRLKVTQASMYDGSHLGPVPSCRSSTGKPITSAR
jgi:hypothetical protein